eukprot:scaffold792_cov122-Isochrysis_galbana.AAC.5
MSTHEFECVCLGLGVADNSHECVWTQCIPQTQQSADAEERASLKKLGAIAFGESVAPRHGASPRVRVERLHGERAGTADPPHVNDVASRQTLNGKCLRPVTARTVAVSGFSTNLRRLRSRRRRCVHPAFWSPGRQKYIFSRAHWPLAQKGHWQVPE